MLAPPAEAVYTLLAGAETMVLSHAIHEGYILLRCRSKKCRAGKTSKFGWFVLMLASTRIGAVTSQRVHESFAVQQAVSRVHLLSQLTEIQWRMIILASIMFFSTMVLLRQFISGLWLSKTSSTSTKEHWTSLLIPPRGKLVLRPPRQSVPWQDQGLHPRSSWRQSFKATQTAISFHGTYLMQTLWSGKNNLLEEHQCCRMSFRQTTFYMLTTVTIKVE